MTIAAISQSCAHDVVLDKQMMQLPVSMLGKFVYHGLRYRRSVVMANIDQVYGSQLSPAAKIHLAQAFYSHLIIGLREFFTMRFISKERLREIVEVRGHAHMLKVAAEKKGVLVLTGHFGNWELAPVGGILNFTQFQGQFHFIRRILVNKFFERIAFRGYTMVGLNVIPQRNSLQQICDVLDKNHAVVFVLDQHASVVNRDGIAVEFFGKKAGTYRSLATLSRYTSVPVVPAANYRLPNGKHVLEFFEPIAWQDYPTAYQGLYYNTLAYNQALERIILEHPEQWNWFHKRWKLSKKELEEASKAI